MAKKEKRIDVKKVQKGVTVSLIQEMFASMNIEISLGTDYGMTDSTLIVHYDDCDIQVKVVAPSAKNGTRYPSIEE